MLQTHYKFMSISALALAALGLTATAQDVCDLTDGLSAQPAAFQSETAACFEGLNGVQGDSYMTNELRRLTNEVRAQQGRDALGHLSSLDQAARIHGYDMAVRDYISHDDPEGRSQLDRVRMIDRSVLIGAFGANLAVVGADATPEEAFRALMSDPANAANLTREEFDHLGVTAVRSGDRIYLMQLFARVEGRLRTPVPATLDQRTDLQAQFAESRAEPVGWSVVSPDGQVLARGIGEWTPEALPAGQSGYLNIDMALGKDRYTLKGPAVSHF